MKYIIALCALALILLYATSAYGDNRAELICKNIKQVQIGKNPIENVPAVYWLYKKQIKRVCDNARMLVKIADENGVDPFILAAKIWRETRWKIEKRKNERETSCGLSQINCKYPGYWKYPDVETCCLEMMKPRVAIKTGARELGRLHKKYADIKIALAAYNAGERNKHYKPAKRYAMHVVRLANFLRKD